MPFYERENKIMDILANCEKISLAELSGKLFISLPTLRRDLIKLEKKGLICIDFEKPLRGADMSAYKSYPIHGSMALTARGQQVLDILEKQGAAE